VRAEAKASGHTLCETAKLTEVEPRSYLLAALLAALDRPGTVTFP
jgi:hypothetical protein